MQCLSQWDEIGLGLYRPEYKLICPISFEIRPLNNAMNEILFHCNWNVSSLSDPDAWFIFDDIEFILFIFIFQRGFFCI